MKINKSSQRVGITQWFKVMFFLGGRGASFPFYFFFSLFPFSFFSLVSFFILVLFLRFLSFFSSFFFRLFIFLLFPSTLWRPFLLWLLGLLQVYIFVQFLEQLMALLVFHCPLGVGVGPFVTFHVLVVGFYFPNVVWINMRSIVSFIRFSF